MLFTALLAFSQEVKEIKVENFDQIKLEGSAQWVIVPSDVEKVIIESKSSDIFNYVEVVNDRNTLIISTNEKAKNITKLFQSVTIKVYVKDISAVLLSGVGSVRMDKRLDTDEFTATLKGTGDMSLDLSASKFEGYVHGTGSIDISGSSEAAIVRVEGVGSYDGYNFETTDCDVTVSGVGDAKVNASSKLTATINGVGSIRYKGDPVKKEFQSNGLGSIKAAK